MFHYLFTNDLRISNLEFSLIEAGQRFQTGTVPTATEDKSANNNIMTLGFYFNLYHGSNCAELASKGNIRKVVLNFIRKFQYPNMRTTASYNQAVVDGIKLVPMRLMVKLLFTMMMSEGRTAYLTRDEIKNFIFYNEAVAKAENPDIVELYLSIKQYRKNSILPETVVTDERYRIWKQEDRQIREMIKILKWSGFVQEASDGSIYIEYQNLNSDVKADIFEIIASNEFWNGTTIEDYRSYMDITDGELEEQVINDIQSIEKNIVNGKNIIYYGAPGTGKSNDLEEKSKKFDFVERVTFYPEYTHDDFIGCFMPCMSYVQDDTTKYISADGTPSKVPGKPVPYYTYVPGPFTNALVEALNNPDKNVLLIIEELNRANAAAVFGEIFQLLDRKDNGESKYSISISNEYSEYLSSEIETYSKGNKIKIPDNLTICATMNSADQGVNPLDSAFKRRWNFEYIPIDFSKANHKDYEIDYAKKKVTWEVFATTINEQLKGKDINEDKHLGQYFVTETEIVDSYKFASKILLYLFDDVLKFDRRGFFKGYKTFSDLLTAFNEGKEVFEFTFKYVEVSIESKEENSENLETAKDIDVESKVTESNDIKYDEDIENEEISRVAEE